jgi:hypothetical protein
MPDKPIEIFMLQNIQAEQGKMNERLDEIDRKVYDLAQNVARVKGSTSVPTEKPWLLTHVVAPFLVALLLATGAAVITLLVKVSRIEGYLNDNAGFIAGLRLQQNSTDPTNPQNVADARQVLETAKKKKFKIPPEVVQSTGVKFVQAAHTNPNAWNAALAFLDYHSFQNNVKLLGNVTPLRESEVHYHYDVDQIGPFGRVSLVPPLIPQDEAAKLHRLDKPDQNINLPMGPSFILLEDATYSLDSMYVRRAIFRNSVIVYRGGPVVLDNVTFVNCTFQIAQRPNGVNFATVFLEQTLSMTFKADAERLSLVVQP